MDLALFDFDGTITVKGTYPGFVRLVVPLHRTIAGTIILTPLIVGYRCRLVSDRLVRLAMSKVAFWGGDADRVRKLGSQYAETVLPGLVRTVALDRIAWHKARGDRVVVVSASLEDYLAPWCRAHGVELICTQLEARDGRLTGAYVGGDCCGDEKARRVRDRYTLADYETIHAYGDTGEDRQMLEMADRKYFRWEEVREPR